MLRPSSNAASQIKDIFRIKSAIKFVHLHWEQGVSSSNDFKQQASCSDLQGMNGFRKMFIRFPVNRKFLWLR